MGTILPYLQDDAFQPDDEPRRVQIFECTACGNLEFRPEASRPSCSILHRLCGIGPGPSASLIGGVGPCELGAGPVCPALGGVAIGTTAVA
jgi:hypothetical protein